MKKLFYIVLAGVMVLSCAGCSGKDDNDAQNATATTVATNETETTTTAAENAPETTYITVTDAEGNAVTDAEGNAVTMAAQVTYINVTDDTGATVTDADGGTVTSALLAPITTEASAENDGTEPNSETTTEEQKPTPAPTAKPTAPSVQKTTPNTTAKPTTPATQPKTDPTTAPTTAGRVPNNSDPWQWPCDPKGMEADCKAYVESMGWHWDDSLTLEKGSWEGNKLTYWGNGCENGRWMSEDGEVSVFDTVKLRINGDHQDYGSIYFRCIFVPDDCNSFGERYTGAAAEAHQGHYKIYIVH